MSHTTICRRYGRGWRCLVIAGCLLGLVAACTVDPRRCARPSDCFASEQCVDGTCVHVSAPLTDSAVSDAEGATVDTLDLRTDSGGCTSDEACPAERPECHEGRCVACTPENEAAVCGEYSCDPSLHRCTTTETGSLDSCQPCAADSECVPAHRCVPMSYKDTPLAGGYCIRVSEASDCPRPYRDWTTLGPSLSGDPAKSYCAPFQWVTTCAAMEDYWQQPCKRDEDCGLGLGDGVCLLPFEKCIYRCEFLEDCMVGSVCVRLREGGDSHCLPEDVVDSN